MPCQHRGCQVCARQAWDERRNVSVVYGHAGCEAVAHDGMANGDREVSGVGIWP